MHYWQQQPSEMAVVGPKMPAKLSSSQPYKHASGKDWDSQCSWCLLSSYGNNIPGSNGNHATHTASQQHMKNRQVAEMLTVYTQVQMVISKRVSGSASYGILVLTGVPPFYSLPTSDTYYTEKSRITLKVLGNMEMAVTHHKQCSTIFNSNIHLKNLNA